MIPLTAVGLLLGGCVNIPERQRSGIEESETSWTITANRAASSPFTPARPSELRALKEINQTLRLQLADLLLENRELKGILGVVVDSDDPSSVVQGVVAQLSDLRVQNEELRERIARLNTENNQLRRTLVTLQQQANDARREVKELRRQAEQARTEDAARETLRRRSAELEKTNEALVSTNEELRRLLAASRRASKAAADSGAREEPPDAEDRDAVPLVTGNLRIHALLPNPAGNERMDEAAILVNDGLEAVRMEGWRLIDLAGRVWFLDSLGTLEPGQKKTIKRENMIMGLNNRGDTVELLSPQGETVHRVQYETTRDDEWIFFDAEANPSVALSRAEFIK